MEENRGKSFAQITLYNKLIKEMDDRYRIYAIAFLVRGMNVWGSSFFTALNNGAVSAAISFLCTFVFQIVIVLILPKLIGITGVWLSIVLAEFLALFVTIGFLIAKRKQYHYA